MRFILLIFLLFPYVASSQQALISGRILQKNKKPLSAANIFISGSYDGASSDSLGFFHFSSALKGPQTLLISAVGLQPQKASIDLKDSIYLTIILQADQQAIEEVLIRAGQFKVGQQANAALSPLDIVTTAGSMGNIIAALEKLPGAQIAGENGRLMVRGGDPWETQTYINGFRVAQPYTASANGVPVRGHFSPFLFKGTNFSTGGYSAEFGNALSSILNLSTDVKLAEPKTDLSFSSIGLGLSNSQTWKNSSLSINGTYSNLGPYLKIIPQDIVWEKPYQQTNAEAIYRTKSDKHFFNLYAAYIDERFAFEDYAIAYDQSVKTSIHENNIYLNSNISYYLPAGWKFDLGGSGSYSQKDLAYHEFKIPTTEMNSHLKFILHKNSKQKLQYSFGIEHFYQKLDEQYIDHKNRYTYGFNRQILAAFSEANYALLANLSLSLGLRYTQDFDAHQSLEPRLAVGYEIDRHQQVSFSYGLFHQQTANEIAKYAKQLPWQKAQHYIFNYSFARKQQLLRVELFQKNYAQLVLFNSMTPTFQSQFSSKGFGTVRGLDLFWRDALSIKNIQYWLSYSYTDAVKLEKAAPHPISPDYVAKHYLSVVAKYWYSPLRSQFSLTHTYISGRPYHNPNLSGYMQSRTSGQNNLAFSWSYLLSQEKILFFSLTNVLGNKPIYGYQYSQKPNDSGIYASQAVVPNAKRFIFLGFFWTISKNKNDNQLDNL